MKQELHNCKKSDFKVFQTNDNKFIFDGLGGIMWSNGLIHCDKCEIVITEIVVNSPISFGALTFKSEANKGGYFNSQLSDDDSIKLTL